VVGLVAGLSCAAATAQGQTQDPAPTPGIPQVTDAIAQFPDAAEFVRILKLTGFHTSGGARGDKLFLVGSEKTCSSAQKAVLASIKDKASADRYINDHVLSGEIGIYTAPNEPVRASYIKDVLKPTQKRQDISNGQSLTVKAASGRPVVISSEQDDIRVGGAKILDNLSYPELNGSFVRLDNCGDI